MSKEDKKVTPANARDLRDKFLKEAHNALTIMNRAVIASEGVEQLSESQHNALKLYWPTLSTVITSVTDRERIDVSNVASILAMVSSGTISIQDAKELMVVMKLGAEITAIEKGASLENGLPNAPGVTIVLPEGMVNPKQVEDKGDT